MKKITGICLIFMMTIKIGFPQPNVYYLSVCGAVSDADPEMNSVTFGTDNTAVIQGVLDKAKLHPIIVYWDGKYSVTGLKIYSNTSIIAFEGCGAILRNHSDQCLLRNADISFTSFADSNISIQGGIWNGNGFNDLINPAQVHDNPDGGFLGWNSVFQFFGVENLKIKDAIIYKPRTFAMHAGKIKNVFIQNVKIDVGEKAPINCDGLYFVGPSENITIRDCDILAKDDHIAFNCPEEPGGAITNVTIDNIRLAGGLFGIRLYSTKDLVDKIMISNIHGMTREYWLVAEGQIGHISASNIIHSEAGKGQGTFNAKEGITIPEIVLTNYTGNQPLCGKGKFQKTRGEGFNKTGDNQ